MVFQQMPKAYYETTPRSEKIQHLSAIVTGHVFESKQTIEFWNQDQSQVTHLGPGSDQQILVDMAAKLRKFDLKAGSLYFSQDNLLFLSSFSKNIFRPLDLENPHIQSKTEAAQTQLLSEYPEYKNEVNHFIQNLDSDFVKYANVNRLSITFRMLLHMLSHEGAHTIIQEEQKNLIRLTLGIKGARISELLDNTLHLFHRYQYKIVRAFVVQFDKGYDQTIDIMHFVFTNKDESAPDIEKINLIRLTKALKTLAWVDTDRYTQLGKAPTDLSTNAVNLIRGFASWVHIILGKENPYYYSEYKIFQTFRAHSKITDNLVNLFRTKFSTFSALENVEERYDIDKQKLLIEIEKVIDRVERKILRESVRFVDNTLKTNYFFPGKTGLAFRLSPDVLDETYYPQRPYGIFFILGRDYRFFRSDGEIFLAVACELLSQKIKRTMDTHLAEFSMKSMASALRNRRRIRIFLRGDRRQLWCYAQNPTANALFVVPSMLYWT